jgi:hypothetical protein
MTIQMPKHFKDVEITKTNWFIAKSKADKIKIELPKPNIKWWVDGYNINGEVVEIMLVDSTEER